MENIVQFPTKAVRDWLVIERELITQLSLARVSDAVKARMSERMKAFWETLNYPFDLGGSVAFPATISPQDRDAICAAIGDDLSEKSSAQLQAFTQALFIERLKCEFDMCGELGLLS